MGNWAIIINGCGQHHNKDRENDADEIFKAAVQKLKEAGQHVEYAAIVYGGQDMGCIKDPAIGG